eukprot:g7700.t1
MRTTFSTVVLCLVLCVAGSYATRVERSLKQFGTVSRGPPPGGNTLEASLVAMTPAAYTELVRALSSSLQFVFETPGHIDRTADFNANNFAIGLVNAYGFAIGDSVFGPPVRTGACRTLPVNMQSYSPDLASAVFDAFIGYSNEFIQSASSCFSEIVERLADALPTSVNYERCPNIRDNFLTQIMRRRPGGLLETVREAFIPVYNAFRDRNSRAARTCSNQRTGGLNPVTQRFG